MGPLCPCPSSKNPMKKVPGASHGAPTDPGPSALPEFPNGQSAPGYCKEQWQKLPKNRCAKLVASYSKRLEAVICAKGASTNVFFFVFYF
ncbi:unnamed protein product, partial [Staurois parvus]